MTKKKEPELSPVLRLMTQVWNNTCTGTDHAWGRVNSAMHGALRLAIGAGFKFDDGDFKAVLDGRFNHHYWMSDCFEWCYSFAITEGNYTAATSYESYKGRTAFIADDVTPVECYNTGFAHKASERQKERLHVGAQFQWKGERVKVTSFADDGLSLTACSYHERKEGSYADKIKRRYKITREDIIAERAEVKERKVGLDQLGEIANSDSTGATRRTILAELGADDSTGFATVPLKKIRAVLKKYKVLVAGV